MVTGVMAKMKGKFKGKFKKCCKNNQIIKAAYFIGQKTGKAKT